MKCVLFFALAAAVVQEVTPVQKVAGVGMQRAGISASGRHEVAAVFAGVCSFPKCYSAMLGVSAFVCLVIVVCGPAGDRTEDDSSELIQAYVALKRP